MRRFLLFRLRGRYLASPKTKTPLVFPINAKTIHATLINPRSVASKDAIK